MEYYDSPPTHRYAAEIEALENKLDEANAEYYALCADGVDWTEAGEDRCIYLEKRIKELEREINSLYYYE